LWTDGGSRHIKSAVCNDLGPSNTPSPIEAQHATCANVGHAGIAIDKRQSQFACADLRETTGARYWAGKVDSVGMIESNGAIVRDASNYRSVRAAVPNLERTGTYRSSANIGVGRTQYRSAKSILSNATAS